MPVNFRKNTRLPYLICLALLLGIASITWITTKASANSDDFLTLRETKTSLSHLSVSREAADYLTAIKKPGILSAGFNLFDNGHINTSQDNFTASGDLDASFGTGGVATTAIGASSQANATVIQPDGKIVVSGTSYANPDSGFALARYNANGTLDTTFGTGGKVFTAIGSTGQSYALALQSDGKIVAAGFAGNGANNDFAIARYNTNGSLDTTFDNDGIVIAPIGAGSDEAYAVAVQPDGRIVVAGHSNNGTNDQIALVRLNNNGSFDNSFDGDGKVTTPVSSGSEYAFALKVQPDGKIVTGGVSGSPSIDLVARFNTTGSLDISFGTGGRVFTDFGANDYVTALGLSPDGKVVAAGFTDVNGSNDFAVARYNTNGSLDTSFGGGKVITPVGASRDEAFAVAVQADGGIIVGGSASVAGNQDFALVRYQLNGALDTAFGSGGKITTNIGAQEDTIRAIAIQTDGKVVVAGYKQTGAQTYNFAVARYLLNPVAAVYVIANTNDSGAGSLRQAIIDANNSPADDTIMLQSGLGDIILTSGQIEITSPITIIGNPVNSSKITRLC